jgi:hypothetical protein
MGRLQQSECLIILEVYLHEKVGDCGLFGISFSNRISGLVLSRADP